MNETRATRDEHPASLTSADLANDWVTIWQSELAAIAADRESAEHMLASVSAWFAASAMLRAHDRGRPVAPRAAAVSGADAPSRAAPADAASDAGGAVERLERRLAELERQLAGLAAGRPADGPGNGDVSVPAG